MSNALCANCGRPEYEHPCHWFEVVTCHACGGEIQEGSIFFCECHKNGFLRHETLAWCSGECLEKEHPEGVVEGK